MLENLCALCGKMITDENDSPEHIIPNAIGGRKEITGFICEDCNIRTGRGWESKLAKKLNPLSLYFRIKRDRKRPPSQSFQNTNGETIKLHHNGTLSPTIPTFEMTPIEGGYNLKGTFRSRKELRKKLKKLKGKEFPDLNIEHQMSKAQTTQSYQDQMIHLEINMGGIDEFRSIVKTALALAFDAGVSPIECERAWNFLNNDQASQCWNYHNYKKDLILDRPLGIPFHCVAIQSIPTTGQLIGYVEYFGFLRIIITLSDKYQGNAVKHQYAINPEIGREIELNIDLGLDEYKIGTFQQPQNPCFSKIESSLSKIIAATQAKHESEELRRLIDDALKSVQQSDGKCQKCSPEEYSKKMTSLVMAKITPFLVRNFSRSNKHR